MILGTLLLLVIQLDAQQCPPASRSDLHRVQPGETLYAIARTYGTDVDALMRVNGITDPSQMRICSELQLPAIEFYARGAEDSRIATAPNPAPTTMPTRTVFASEDTYAARLQNSRGTHIAAPRETVSSVAAYYGYTESRLREMNSLDDDYTLRPGAVLVVNDCALGSESAAPKTTTTTTTGTPASNEVGIAGVGIKPAGQPTDLPPRVDEATDKAAASYMQSEELAMVDEINLVRSNPAGYIPYVEAYKAKILRGEGFGSAAVCDELIAELRSTPPRSILKPRECLYRAARVHGEDQRPTGDTNHVGTDGSWPWDRVLRACPELTDGNENLVGGPSTVRESVMILLIDDGIPNRGHRKTMLQEDWRYVACYKIGKVGMMPNSWVQKFAY